MNNSSFLVLTYCYVFLIGFGEEWVRGGNRVGGYLRVRGGCVLRTGKGSSMKVVKSSFDAIKDALRCDRVSCSKGNEIWGALAVKFEVSCNNSSKSSKCTLIRFEASNAMFCTSSDRSM